MITKVLVPLDGSKLAEEVLPYISSLARDLGVPVVLTSVVSDSVVTDNESTSPHTATSEYLEGVADSLFNQGLEVEWTLAPGTPAKTILQVAHESDSDLIAMSSHGRNMLTRTIFGSVSDNVIRSTDVSVLILTEEVSRTHTDEGTMISNIIVPLDGSDFAETALAHAERLAELLSLPISLVRVIDTGGPYTGILDDARMAQVNPELVAEASEYLDEVAQTLVGKGLEVWTKVLDGTPGPTIAEFARGMSQSLIVLTSHGRSGVQRWRLGSVADSVIRSSADPVLIVPAPANLVESDEASESRDRDEIVI